MSYLRRGQKESRRMMWIFFWSLLVASCAAPAIVTPPTQGCRNNEQTCSDHACCPESNFVCGGDDPHCFANYCCPVGGPLGPQMKVPDAGATEVHDANSLSTTPPPGAILKRRP